MKLADLIHESPAGKMFSLVLVILFTLCVGLASSASEPGTITIVRPDEPERLDPGDCGTGNVSQVLTNNVLETLTATADIQ